MKNKYAGKAFEEIEVKSGSVKVVLEDIGEGYNGDFDEDDPEDAALIRFTVYKKEGKEWVQVDDASYCTTMTILDDREKLTCIARSILEEVKDPIESGYSVKKLCERLSWLHTDSVTDADLAEEELIRVQEKGIPNLVIPHKKK